MSEHARDLAGQHAGLRILVGAAALVIVIAGMRAAAPILVPFLLATFITIISSPPLFFLRRKGLPTWLALLTVIAAVIAVGGLLVLMIHGSLDSFTANLPDYQSKLHVQAIRLRGWIGGLGLHLPEGTIVRYLDPGKAMGLAGQMISGLGGALANAFLILLTVVFMLLETAGFPAKLRAMLNDPEPAFAMLSTFNENILRYVTIKTLTSLGTGLLVFLWLKLLGVDYPGLWGLLAFMLNYVPNIGSIIASVPAILLALIQFGPASALWTGAGYLTINILIGSIIEPRFMGRGLGLSTLVVFASLVLWGWVLGPVGMFLSVPLTMIIKIALNANAHTRPIAILLGPEISELPPQTPE